MKVASSRRVAAIAKAGSPSPFPVLTPALPFSNRLNPLLGQRSSHELDMVRGEEPAPVEIVRLTPSVKVAVCWHGSLAAIVKEHQDPKTTGRYVHVVDRALTNPAAAVPMSV